MKRKFSLVSSSDSPSPICPPFPRGFHGVGSSKIQLNTIAPRETRDSIPDKACFGIYCKERTRFTELDNDKSTDSFPAQRNQAPISDNPKTSEYTFFKKLKEDAAAGGYKIHSQSLHQHQNQCSKFNSKRSNVSQNRHKDFKSSLLSKNLRTSDNSIRLNSLPGNASKTLAADVKMVVSPLENVPSDQGSMEECGFRCKNTDIFSRVRQRLRQLVANTSCHDADELCSKGCDFVSALLRKLFPLSIEEKNLELPKTGKLETDTKSGSMPSLESYSHFKKSHWKPASNLELENGQSFDVGFLSSWSELPRERTCSTYLDNGATDLSDGLGERTSPIVMVDGDSAFDMHIKKRSSLTSGHFKELADSGHSKELTEFNHPIEPSHERELHNLQLGWDFDDMADKSNRQDAEQSLLTVIPSSPRDVQLPNLDDRFGARRLETSSLFLYHPPTLPSLCFSPSARSRTCTFEERFPEVKDGILSVLRDFSLSLLLTENHINLDKYFYRETAYRGSNILLSPKNNLWFMKKVLNEKHLHPGIETCFSPKVDFCLEPKCSLVSDSWRYFKSPTCHTLESPGVEDMPSYFLVGDKNENYLDIGHYCEDTVNMKDGTSMYFQMPVNNEVCPLLLDISDTDEFERQMYLDDNEMKL